MLVKTSDVNLIKTLFKKLVLPQPNSHKGQNGKVLIIGGSSLFHAASLWAAEVCSHFSDMVHYSSTLENEKIFHELKKIFRNGIIVPQKELDHYIKEDDVVLIGPGMVRGSQKSKVKSQNYNLKVKSEAQYTRQLVFYLIDKFPEKKFVFDAGALQMMDKEWLMKLKTPAIITPHQKEFERLFGISILDKPQKEKENIVKETSDKYKTTILLKAVVDIISDGSEIVVVEGGNAGLTKGGTGDVLAGLTSSFYAKNTSLHSSIFASILLKITSEELFKTSGYWYNIDDIIKSLPKTLKNLL
ncbi:MAG: Carbohydrate kinase, YjeF related protein [Candidatus Roizmanbacteria bacterium GW2011_GWC2_37_13]|uniref:ADP-dependent (S)-NAD(P)H-hydrate dehydratase n=1 Tax=Candidatus Roizmanbacteria bacterium GW2011_GWC2_37_13 TaxID=1618486 RepID=A0A0G0IQV8_9BACT|nr:MAG: Carbohydrate kinase, YjeF related protein [Candidatus Roizmanbacteria bacterium GW2011_GWC1_37_12]KKQ26569.1 MAG: Carbohydrate kinase, YjeF related protein [Candidatus Roizmanbacteria bacterium GW2011_GWC2_37_13]